MFVEPGEGAGHGGHEEGEGDDEEELADAVEGLGRERLGLGEAGGIQGNICAALNAAKVVPFGLAMAQEEKCLMGYGGRHGKRV